MRFSHNTLVSSVLAGLAGCGGAPHSAPDAGPAVDIAGHWQSACVDPGSGKALRLGFDITGSTWQLAYESFDDVACATPMLTVHIDGPYAIVRPSPVVAGAFDARFAFTHKTVTPNADAAVAFLPQACGGGTFSVGVATDISAGCAGLGSYPIASCPADYDLIARDGDHLQFGNRPADNNMCTEDKRPAALSPLVLARQ